MVPCEALDCPVDCCIRPLGGGILITPVIAQLIDRHSLVALAPQLAVSYWILVVPITLLLLRPSPQDLGLRPDGAAAAEVEVEVPISEAPGVPFAVAVRTPYFRLVSAAFIFVMGAQVGAVQHLFKLTKDATDVDAASLALIVVTSTSVVACIIGGLAATRLPLAVLTTVLMLVEAVGILIIGLAQQQWTILIGVVLLGVAMGSLLVLHPLLLADAFGIRNYPRIYGFGSLLMITGVGLGSFAIGLIRDATSYRAAFVTMAGVAIVGLAVFRATVRTGGSIRRDDWSQDRPAKTEAMVSIDP